ncbi:DMT family transporter [Paracoccus rhizosphaerae]|uniref:DMT family transporter n=1 Tax=Paracoccus rhizosphaerae TaxID=1133347 RepID=A0ABV6CE12_9RHOB|nr:SMR family transporter [Paracoccus rhizosphaerae]
MTKHYALLLLAIIAEVIATTALAKSASFTRLAPSIIAVIGYAAAFWFLSSPMRVMPTGIVYAIWSGMGIVLISAIAWVWYQEALDLPAMLGLAFILIGVVIINVFSKSLGH